MLGALRYNGRNHVPGIQIGMNRLRGRIFGALLMQLNEYALPAVFRMFEAHGFGEITVDPEWQERNASVHLIAKKHS